MPEVVQINNEKNDLSNVYKLIDFLIYCQIERVQRSNYDLIIYADDQYANQQSIEMNLKDLNISDRLLLLSNGLEVIQKIDNILQRIEHAEIQQQAIQPITLLLLDINMPIMTGYEVLTHVKEKFKDFMKRDKGHMNTILGN